MAAGYSDGTLRIFQIASSEMEMKLHPHDGVAVTAIQYSATGERQELFPCFVFSLVVSPNTPQTAVGAACFYTELSSRAPAVSVY